jgi:hypothetical protein
LNNTIGLQPHVLLILLLLSFVSLGGMARKGENPFRLILHSDTEIYLIISFKGEKVLEIGFGQNLSVFEEFLSTV